MPYRGSHISADSERALEGLSLLSNKWSPVIVLLMLQHGSQGFNELLETIPDISSKVLSDSLDRLQDAGLVERQVLSESPLRVEYDLTDAGRELEPVFEAVTEWAESHLESATQTVVLADSDRRITEMYQGWLTDRFTIVRAHTSEELSDRLDDEIDVVLLDAGLPDADLDTFVGGYEEPRRTILIVGDRPDLDVLSVDCDDLLRKPFVRETVLEAIDDQLSRRGEPVTEREFASLTARRSLFESVYTREQLEADNRYRELVARLATLQGESSS